MVVMKSNFGEKYVIFSGSNGTYYATNSSTGIVDYSGSAYLTVKNSVTGSLSGSVFDQVSNTLEGYASGQLRTYINLTGSTSYIAGNFTVTGSLSGSTLQGSTATITTINTTNLIATNITGSTIVSGSSIYGANAKFTNLTGSEISTTGNIYASGSISETFDESVTLGTDHTAVGVKKKVILGATVNFGDVIVKASTGKYILAKADSATTTGPVLLALQSGVDTNIVMALVRGQARDDTWAWATGSGQADYIYITTTGTTGNTLTKTAPSTVGNQVQVVGMVEGAKQIYFDPNWVVVEV